MWAWPAGGRIVVSAPWWERLVQRLEQASWGRGQGAGHSGTSAGVRGQWQKRLQALEVFSSLSADGWGCLPKQLFGLRCSSTGSCRLLGGAKSSAVKWRPGRGFHQHQRPSGRTSCPVHRASCSHPLPLRETLQDQQVGLA